MGSILSLLMGLATAQGEGSEGAEITTVHPIVFVESERQGEAYEAYRRIRSDRPLELKLSAPGRVFVSVRTLIGSRSGPHQLQFEVDGETVKEAQVSPRRDDLARFVETVPGRLPGEKRTFLVPVEASADSFPRRLTVWLVKGKEILLSPRYASPLELELELDEAGTSTAP